MSEGRDLDRIADNAEDELRASLLRGRIAQEDNGDQYAAWILDRAARIKRQRRVHMLENALVVLLVLVIAGLILIVLRWAG